MNSFKTLWQYRELLLNLTIREIKARYKQSILGYFWVILNPFFQMLVMAFVFSKILRFKLDYNIPYTLFLYSGILPWSLFVNSVSSSMGSLISNASLIRKIYFPREIFLLATTFAKIVDFFLASSIFFLFMVIYKVSFSSLLPFFIFIFFIQIIFSLGISFFLAPFNLFYRDVKYLMNLVFQLWFYLTPVIYPVEAMPKKMRIIFQLNPMSVLINAYRRSFFGGGTLNFSSLTLALLLSSTLFLAGYYFFKKTERMFADVA